MKNQNTTMSAMSIEAMQARYALRVAAHLNEASRDIPHDISERLKAAREQALERARLAKRVQAAAAAQPVGNGATAALTLGGGRGSSHDWWLKLASALPIIVLIAGFLLVERLHTRQQIAVAAEIDAALLADDVPPAAYSDPGFVEFLKTPRD